MSRAQRLTFLAIAVVIAVVAVVIIGSSGDDDEQEAATGATATPTATATSTPDDGGTAEPTETPTPEPQPPLVVPGKVTKLRFTEGETVRFRVRAPAGGEEIHVHGYDIERAIPDGRPTTVSFPADITGIFEIEFHGSGEQIAQLRVDPD